MGPFRRIFRLATVCLLAAVGLGLAPARAEPRRVALVVGIGQYRHAPALRNTLNDARDTAAALQRLGFEVETLIDPDRLALEEGVYRLGQRAQGAETALFYYAGHALEIGGRNWLIPASAELKGMRRLRFEALDLDTVLEQTEGAARITLVLLDSCRDNPFRALLAGQSRDIPRRGLAQVNAGAGTLVAFATAPGTVAVDGSGRNSPFTAALLKHIETPGLEIRGLLAEVRREVREATQGQQVPWENSALEGQFYFRPAPSAPAPASQPRSGPGAADAEVVFWESVRNSRNPADVAAYLSRYPNGVFADLARNRLAQLQASEAPEKPSREAAPSAPESPSVESGKSHTSARGRILTREPPAGALPAGQRVLVDDGTCPSGEIKELVGGRDPAAKRGQSGARQRRCIAR